jgi:hypothetical protein
MSTLAASELRKLPVWRTVGECYMTVAWNLGQLVRMCWLWFVVVAAMNGAVHWLELALGDEPSLLLYAVALVVGGAALVIEGLFLASIAVAWHRLILRQERVTGAAYLRLDRPVWLYLIYSLFLIVLAQLPLVVSLALVGFSDAVTQIVGDLVVALGLSLAGGLFLLLGSALAILLVLPRLSLVLPAVALEQELSLREAWRASRANTVRLALATALCMLPTFLLLTGELIAFMRALTGGEDAAHLAAESLGYAVFKSLAYAVLAIFAVTLLSLTYRFFAPAPAAAAAGNPS